MMDSLNDEYIHELLRESGIVESLRLEFKQQLNLTKISDKIELAKDVTEMCNTPGGGCLLYGFNNEGHPIGTNLDNFERDKVAQIIADRCQFASPGIDVRVLKYQQGQSLYDIGVISVPESRFDLPASFKDKSGRDQVPIRIGAVTKHLSPLEAIQYYRQKRTLVLPESAKINLASTGIYDSTFSTKKPSINFKRQPFERMFSLVWPAIPIYLPYAPKFNKAHTVLSVNCGTILSQDWQIKLAELEKELQRRQGILTQCWTIRNWELISPLPEETDYVLGPSMECLKDTLESGQIKQHAYFAWAALAYRQVLYVISGPIKGPLNIRAYMTYIPSSNEFICFDNDALNIKVRDLSFTKVEGQDIIDWTGVSYYTSQGPELCSTPIPVSLCGYIGSPDRFSDIQIRGLTILRLDGIGQLGINEGKTDLFPVFGDNLLPCYISSKFGPVNEDKLNSQTAKLSHLTIDCQYFPDIDSIVYLFTVDAGLIYHP